MDHKPFEEWIMGDEILNPEQERALQEHLQSCESCAPLAQAWQELRLKIEPAPQITPPPGFTQRWQTSLQTKRAAQQRRRAWKILGLCLGIILVSLGLLYIPEILQLSPGALLANLLTNTTLFIVNANHTREVIEVFFGGISPLLPATILILAASSLTWLSIIWIFTMWKIIVPKGEKA